MLKDAPRCRPGRTPARRTPRCRRPARRARRRGSAQRRVIEVGPPDGFRGREHLARQRRLSPSHHLRVEPCRLRRIGPRRAVAADQQIALVAAERAVRRDLQPSVQRAADHLGCDADPVRRSEQRGDLVAVVRVVDEVRGAPVRAHESRQHVRLLLGPALPHREQLLGGARENLGDEMQDVADAEIDRDRIPRRADAEAVHVPVLQALHHVGRRQHDEAHVLVRIDAARRHPEAQVIVVRRERKRHAEGEGILATRPCAPRPRARARARTPADRECRPRPRRRNRRMQRRRHRDGIAVHAEPERRDDRHLDVAEPEARRDRDGRDQMCGVEQPDIELVAHVRPRHLAHQLDVEALGRAEPLVDRDQQRGRVRERDESDAQPVAHLNSSAAVMTDCATSAIFLFSFIGGLAQQGVGLFFADVLRLHQDALGAIDHLALLERALGAVELVLQPRERVEARDAQVEDGLDALFLQVADDVGRHAGVDRGLDRGGVALVDEHRDRALHRPAHLEHLLQLVAAGVFQVDQDDVGVDRIDAREQAVAVVDVRDVEVTGLAQPVLQDGGADRVLVDDDDLERGIHQVTRARVR